MNLRFIDIHSHLNLEPLSSRREEIIAKMRELNVGTITVATGLADAKLAIEIAEAYPDVCWATVGVHPCSACGEHEDIAAHDEAAFAELAGLANHPKVVAIGETGLDYFHDDTPEMRAEQERVFRKHIALAQSVGKPLMLHVRSSRGSDDAYYDALKILAEFPSLRANFHFFSGSRTCMEAVIAAGFTISVDGPITFVNDYDEMIRAVPLESLMIETDAPFAAPKPYRGKPCEPWMVIEVAKKIAELKEQNTVQVAEQLLKNAQNFFKI